MPGDTTLTEWNGMAADDPVVVSGLRGKFVFQSVRLDGEKALYITVSHAKGSGHMGTRMVTPDRVTKLKVRKPRTSKD